MSEPTTTDTGLEGPDVDGQAVEAPAASSPERTLQATAAAMAPDTVPAVGLVLGGPEARRLAAMKYAAAGARDGRPVLAGVFVEGAAGDGARAVVTDSYRLAMREYPEAGRNLETEAGAVVWADGGAILPAVELSRALDGAAKVAADVYGARVAVFTYQHPRTGEPSSMAVVAVVYADGRDAGVFRQHVTTTTGAYPDYRRILSSLADTGTVSDPPDAGTALAAWNPAYMADVSRLAGYAARDRQTPVFVETVGPRKPAAFRVPAGAGRAELRYVLMPVRV